MGIRVLLAAISCIVCCMFGAGLLVFRSRLSETSRTLYFNSDVFPELEAVQNPGWVDAGILVLALLLIVIGVMRLFLGVLFASRPH